MRYLSLFSGIEAASVAWAGPPLNWTPVGFAEIEPFPCAVLKHHYPEVPNLGNVTTADFVDQAKALEPVDIVVGGSPCTAFSVAGLRQSLDDARGNLTLRYVEIVNALDPAFALWENVPGVLNTHDNAFGCFLAGMVGADAPLISPLQRGRWTDAGMVVGPTGRLAWRILDCQYFGLAQRRRRVFAIRCPRNGADPGQVLLIEEGLRWDTPPRHPTRQATAADVGASLAIRGRGEHRNTELGEPGVANALLTPSGGRDGTGAGAILAPALPEIAGPLGSNTGGQRTTDLEGHGAYIPTFQNHEYGNYRQSDTAETIATSPGRQREANQVGLPDPAYALTDNSGNCTGSGRDGQDTFVVSCPQGQMAPSPEAGCHDYGLLNRAQVRRLTPIEVSRLQGFPDDYLTQVKYKGKPPADGNIYKAIGNSMATPCIFWIGQRIQAVADAALLTSEADDGLD